MVPDENVKKTYILELLELVYAIMARRVCSLVFVYIQP